MALFPLRTPSRGTTSRHEHGGNSKALRSRLGTLPSSAPAGAPNKPIEEGRGLSEPKSRGKMLLMNAPATPRLMISIGVFVIGFWTILARALPPQDPPPPRTPASTSGAPAAGSSTCNGPTLESQEPGEMLGGACVANAGCVAACGVQLGEAVAAEHEPEEDVCNGAPCSPYQRWLRADANNLEMGHFVFCLQQCWSPHVEGHCRWDLDCPMSSNPCSQPRCDDGDCTQMPRNDGERCSGSDGRVGLCRQSTCVGPNEYLAQCGTVAADVAKDRWALAATSARRCEREKCDDFSRRHVSGFRRNLTEALLDCVATAIDAGAMR
jgi:hypothetical protein